MGEVKYRKPYDFLEKGKVLYVPTTKLFKTG